MGSVLNLGDPLNRSHPLAAGLSHLWLVPNSLLGSRVAHDLAGDGPLPFSSGMATRGRPELSRFDTAAGPGYAQDTAAVVTWGPAATLWWFGTVTGGVAQYNALISHRVGGSSGTPYNLSVGGSSDLTTEWGGLPTYTGPAIPTGRDVLLALSVNGTAAATYVVGDGAVSSASGTVSSATLTASSGYLTLGADSFDSGSRVVQGQFLAAGVHGRRALGEGELLALYDQLRRGLPDLLNRFAPRRAYGVAAAVGSATTYRLKAGAAGTVWELYK